MQPHSHNGSPIKVAILGTRGVPARYGGFETFTEELGSRLVRKGYEVTVYCREDKSRYDRLEYKGMKLVMKPTLKHKYFETVAHTFLSSLSVMFKKVDVVYYCNAINSIFMIFPMMTGKKVLMNVDGLEWKRAKWSKIGKLAYQVSEWIAAMIAPLIIADSNRIALYYKKKFSRDTTIISYGSNGIIMRDTDVLARHGLKDRGYFLYVSRLEPENNAHLFVEAYEKNTTDMPLVIVGDAPYSVPYIAKLRATVDPRIRFLGGIYGDEYQNLLSHAYVYFHGNEVGGTNPALLEAMACGNCVLATGVGFNRQVIAEGGLWFKPGNVDDLAGKIDYVLKNPKEVEKYRPLAIQRMKTHYSWDQVTEQYDRLFQNWMSGNGFMNQKGKLLAPEVDHAISPAQIPARS